MDIVVYLAFFVLAAVFLFSLFILVVMCRSRGQNPWNRYNRLIMAQSLRFSKLKQDNLDDILQLGPHITQKLNNNQWMEEVSGILQNCVAVLKLCHLLTENMAKIPLTQITPQINEIICQATTKVVPRFDALLRSMAAKNVDIRVIEARVTALVTACWSLVIPFYLLNPQYKEHLGGIIQEMEIHQNLLQFALEQADNELTSATENPHASSEPIFLTCSQSTSITKQKTDDEENKITIDLKCDRLENKCSNGILRHKDQKSLNDECKDLLNGDEAPADPSTS